MDIVIAPSHILDIKCTDLVEFNLNTVNFMNELVKTMKKKVGLGLSAPQVGIPLRSFVMWRTDNTILKVINPKILDRGKLITSKQEGCLSIPNFKKNMKRNKWIKVQFQNEVNETFKMTLKNLDSFVFQHEYDHLNGVLIND